MKNILFVALALIYSSNLYAQNWIKVGSVAGNSHASLKGQSIPDYAIATDPTGKIYVGTEDFKKNSLTVHYYDHSWKTLPIFALNSKVLSGDCLIATDFAGIVYLVFESNLNNTSGLTVIKFVNNKWVTVGNDFFSNGAGYNPQLAFGADNTPYIAYNNAYFGHGGKITVKKLNGNNWMTLGTESFTIAAIYLSLDVDKSNTPYIAYADYHSNLNAIIQRFDGQSWQTISNATLTGGTYPAIKIDRGNNIIYFSTNSSGLKLYKYANNTWSLLADGQFQGFGGYFQKMMLDKNGIPYIAYSDNDQVTMVKFNITAFELVGNARFSSISDCKNNLPSDHFSCSFDLKNNYPIAGICCDCNLILGNGDWTTVFAYK